jgi:SAM-dependent methyltransferase
VTSGGHRIDRLDRRVTAPPGKPTRPGAADNQQLAASIAAGTDVWDAARARAMAARFDELAAEWDSERGGYRSAPLLDALDRGGPWPRGVCVEVGAGTGLLTTHLRRVWPDVVAVDLSHEMLRRARQPWRVRADASRLPVGDARAAAVVVGDAPLFASEVVRVLRSDGVVVCSNALGDDAPFFVPTGVLVTALADASHRPWRAVCSEAGWGSWAVLRPADER